MMGQGLDRARDEKLYYQRGVVALWTVWSDRIAGKQLLHLCPERSFRGTTEDIGRVYRRGEQQIRVTIEGGKGREGRGGKEQRVDLATVVVGDRHGGVVGISETIRSHVGISIVVGPADEVLIKRGIVTNEVLLLRPLASDL
jgi:hypothetical protein